MRHDHVDFSLCAGHNAALLARLAGPGGTVTTIGIDTYQPPPGEPGS